MSDKRLLPNTWAPSLYSGGDGELWEKEPSSMKVYTTLKKVYTTLMKVYTTQESVYNIEKVYTTLFFFFCLLR